MIPLRLSAMISESGKLIFTDTDILRGWLERYSGKSIEVILKSVSKDKTLPQLGYLFGHVIPQIADYTGYSNEEIYDILKFKFLRVDQGTDRERIVGLSDSDAERTSHFIEDCVRFGRELGAEIFPSELYGGTT